ncbi:magnesium transporter NIPA-domain-containing protein [Xylaria bambusicola]|uniref:magnesium transporter NIPA-domain-containing protein n=1 Tax=Xylaria bambusicola TaxID=326684 RepID=UPI002007B0F1|nr:magnesium transporter NIPA-domain-containing protein [Xylaria bambusicola]KAI0506156.1 magnesium transporter NIPA-domain-containing protein [Xylaria bambusicola]
MGMFVISNVFGSSIQISTLPLPVLSTLQAAGLVFNSICATLILNEPFTKWSFWGTALVALGAALIAVFGAIPSPAHSLSELLELLGRWQFIVWMSLQAVILLTIALSIEFINRFKNISQNPKFRLARGLTYGCISGILSAHSLLFAKSAVELILRTIADSDNQFVHWQSWILVLGLVALALSQLYYLHRGLKLVSTSVLYPLVFCIYNIIAILDGLIYFRQTDLITPLHGWLIALGTTILLSGVLALSWRLSDEQHPPAVGQSSLTPGFGLVEDTEGEDDSAVDSDLLSEEGETIRPTYDTFASSHETIPFLSNHKPGQPWNTEIWDELEDQQLSRPSRPRSSTLPTGHTLSEGTPLLSGRRIPPGGPAAPASGSGERHSGESPRRMFRRRRKSTGFPGFIARKHDRRRSSSNLGVQDALGGILRMRWWRQAGGNSNNGNSHLDIAVASPTGSSSGQPWILRSPRRLQRREDEQQLQQRTSRADSTKSPRPDEGPRGDDAV